MSVVVPQRHDILPGSLITFSGDESCYPNDLLMPRTHFSVKSDQLVMALTARVPSTGVAAMDDMCVVYVLVTQGVGWVELYNDSWFGVDVTIVGR